MQKNSFTKEDFAKSLNIKYGYSLNYSKKIINDIILALIENIRKNNLLLKNIGTFKLKKKKERVGRNPKTGETFIISSRKIISFTTSNNCKKYLNDKIN